MDDDVVDALEAVVMAGVALTTQILARDDAGDLTLPMWRVLVVLGNEPDGATISEVARRIRVTVPATSRQLRRLAGKGLLSLGVDERDHRAMRARLTGQGIALREEVLRRRRAALAEALGSAGLSSTAAQDLRVLADRLRSPA